MCLEKVKWVVFPVFLCASYDHLHPDNNVLEHRIMIFQTTPRLHLYDHFEKKALMTFIAQLENDQEHIALTKTSKNSLTL